MVDCTITNKRKPRVTVTKDLVPSADGGLFDLQVNGSTKADDVGDAGTTGSVNVAVGSNPTVGELAGTGTTLADYESSIECTGDSSASSSDSGPLSLGTLAAGDVVDCTITNKRKPRVKVTKDLVPSSDGGLFDLQVNGPTQGRRRRRCRDDGLRQRGGRVEPDGRRARGRRDGPRRLRVLDRVLGRQQRVVV